VIDLVNSSDQGVVKILEAVAGKVQSGGGGFSGRPCLCASFVLVAAREGSSGLGVGLLFRPRSGRSSPEAQPWAAP